MKKAFPLILLILSITINMNIVIAKAQAEIDCSNPINRSKAFCLNKNSTVLRDVNEEEACKQFIDGEYVKKAINNDNYNSICLYKKDGGKKIVALLINKKTTIMFSTPARKGLNYKDSRIVTPVEMAEELNEYDEDTLGGAIASGISKATLTLTGNLKYPEGNMISGTDKCPKRIVDHEFDMEYFSLLYFYMDSSDRPHYTTEAWDTKTGSELRSNNSNDLYANLSSRIFQKDRSEEDIYILMTEGDRNPNTCALQNVFEEPVIVEEEIDCDLLMGEHDEIKNQIKKFLTYIRILVPVLIIALGLFDFGTAILSSKEDEMKKAQSRFMKRLLIGFIIFLLPTIINLILEIADNAWKTGVFNDSGCGLNN